MKIKLYKIVISPVFWKHIPLHIFIPCHRLQRNIKKTRATAPPTKRYPLKYALFVYREWKINFKNKSYDGDGDDDDGGGEEVYFWEMRIKY